ncbi:MAG: homoserine O-acetyltransferase [Bacteroidales bacterium]|jgi:homoserine O-acetyltransferase|nr:homoserine O-acetyltransferase [Bacteroidales bacterium]
MTQHYYQTRGEFMLESGASLHDIGITYHTAGVLNQAKDNVIWVCHALTANSDVAEWWPNMVGDGLLFDTSRYFIVCANFLGSCYGTTGPLSIHPETGEPYCHEFPLITIRDMVNAHELLRKHLGISGIFMITGGSIGSFQALEWSIMNPSLIGHLVFMVSGAAASPWNIAINESQRMALRADPTFGKKHEKAGLNGLRAARSIALLSYRNAATYNQTQQDPEEKLDNFRAISYQQYQGDKLAKRFSPYAYYTITRAFDTHNVGRHRGGIEKALSAIKARTLLIAIASDILFYPGEIKALQHHIPGAQYVELESLYGHDGFLIETEQLTTIIQQFLSEKKDET